MWKSGQKCIKSSKKGGGDRPEAQELVQKAPVGTQEIQELYSTLLTHQGTTQLAEKAAQLAEKTKEKEEIEEKLKYGATEAEVVAAG